MVEFNFDFIDDDDENAKKAPEVSTARGDLESIPHLASKISGIWGTAELDAFLSHLILDSRDGTRAGFPKGVAAELMFLIGINKAVRAIDICERLSIRYDEAFQMVDSRDQEALKHDALDDPLVSRDSMVRRATPAPERTARIAPAPAAPDGPMQVIFSLVLSKGFLFLLIAVLGGKLAWETVGKYLF